MDEQDQPQDGDTPGADLVRSGAEAELMLLKQERKAERKLAEVIASLERDLARLRSVQEEVSRSRQLVEKAEEALRACQSRRAAGPTATER